MSHITPVYKNKGNPEDPSNYRPIALTCTLCKILEKILLKTLHNYMKDHNLLFKNQSGFQPSDSTINQLTEIYNIIISNLDKGKDIMFIFCDISKAFDKVWHKGLIYKLQKYGIRGEILGWIENYITDRTQKVVIEGYSSGIETTNAGVPQGSVLGPFLFLIYINDIVENICNQIRLFADDTSLFVVVDDNDNNSAKSLTADLEKIKQWSNQWLVDFNPNKTINVNFSRKKKTHPQVSFGNTLNNIIQKNNHCHLGLTLQSNGGWSHHISNIYEKACQRLNMLRILKYKINRESLIKIYFAFIRPVLEYGDVVWDNCTDEQSNLLESIQIEAARIITGLRRNSSKQYLYQELGWETLKKRRNNHKLILLFKILNNYTPEYLSNIVGECFPPHNTYNLRNNFIYRTPVARTTSYFNSFIPSTIILWNNLPQNTKNITTVSAFKNSLKNINSKKLYMHKLFNHGKRLENIWHCQLRNNSSNLNADLYSHHLIASPLCQKCFLEVEDSKHYFLHCPLYASQRKSLFDYMNDNSIPITIKNLLFGSDKLTFQNNLLLFDKIHFYIKSTNRFK